MFSGPNPLFSMTKPSQGQKRREKELRLAEIFQEIVFFLWEKKSACHRKKMDWMTWIVNQVNGVDWTDDDDEWENSAVFIAASFEERGELFRFVPERCDWTQRLYHQIANALLAVGRFSDSREAQVKAREIALRTVEFEQAEKAMNVRLEAEAAARKAAADAQKKATANADNRETGQ